MARSHPKILRGEAQEPIAYGQHVLIRSGRCWPSEPALANAIAGSRPPWSGESGYKKGDFLLAKAITASDSLDVHALAQLPLMDPVRINLPAGTITESAYQERLKLQFREAGIEPPKP